MPSGKTILAAGAALVVLAGAGAGVWIASADDEDGASPLGRSATTETDPSVSMNELPVVPSEQAPAAPEAQPEEQPQAPDAAPGRQDKATRTRFPRERAKQRNDPPARVFEVPPAREFSGTGNASLGIVDVSTAATVKWTTKGRFELRFGRESFPIVAPSPSGHLIVPPYRFEQVRVIARGRWTIRIVPQR